MIVNVRKLPMGATVQIEVNAVSKRPHVSRARGRARVCVWVWVWVCVGVWVGGCAVMATVPPLCPRAALVNGAVVQVSGHKLPGKALRRAPATAAI